VSRLYARYLNGDLNVVTIDGYGTDAIVTLKVSPIIRFLNQVYSCEAGGSEFLFQCIFSTCYATDVSELSMSVEN